MKGSDAVSMERRAFAVVERGHDGTRRARKGMARLDKTLQSGQSFAMPDSWSYSEARLLAIEYGMVIAYENKRATIKRL